LGSIDDFRLAYSGRGTEGVQRLNNNYNDVTRNCLVFYMLHIRLVFTASHTHSSVTTFSSWKSLRRSKKPHFLRILSWRQN